jgi:predicted dinucleotide-binding enzyme
MMGGMGRVFDGGYAEYTCVPASQVIAFHSELDWATLGAVPEMLQTSYGSLTAKHAVIDALHGSGLRALDVGALANSRLLERLTAFGIELGERYKLGFDFGFKYLPARVITPSS